MDNTLKTCSKCSRDLPLSEYYNRSRSAGGGLEAFCKTCKNTYYKREHRWRHLKERYGITEDAYKYLYDQQDGSCAICKTEKDVLCVDHDHSTGDIRGLLCSPCNRAIGLLGDTIEGIRAALNYLEKK